MNTDGHVNGEPMPTAAGDLDGDGRTDLVLAAATGVDVYLQRNGGFTFFGLIDLPGTREAALADVDRDGHLDLVLDRVRGVSAPARQRNGQLRSATAGGRINYKVMETGE